VPNRPRPIAAQAHTFIPVNGSVPPWALAEDPLPEPDESEPLDSDEDACDSEEPLVEGEELLELELELEPELDDELGGELLVVFVSGSTYCWSPAEVLVPEASTAAAPPRKTADSATRHATVRTIRRTPLFNQARWAGAGAPAAARPNRRTYGAQRVGWTMCPARAVAALAPKMLPPGASTCW
jgi:hypothetical protein